MIITCEVIVKFEMWSNFMLPYFLMPGHVFLWQLIIITGSFFIH